MGAHVPVSPSIDILVMVHKTGNRIFFLSDLLTVVICLFESKMKTQKILNLSFFNSQDFLPVEKKTALQDSLMGGSLQQQAEGSMTTVSWWGELGS